MRHQLYCVTFVFFPVVISTTFRCSPLPEKTPGYWLCKPPVTPGETVESGTECQFECNESLNHQVYRCSGHQHWHPDPEQEYCQGISTSTTTSTTFITTPTTTSKTTPTTTFTTTLTTTSTTTTSTNPTATPTTTPTKTPTTTTTTTPTSSSEFNGCPFLMKQFWQEKSLYCPQTYCPAVYIVSNGQFAKAYPDLLGCYNYAGSLIGDAYPLYQNKDQIFMTPHAYSNPIIGFTHWLVSTKVLDTTGFIRNEKHEDQFCPYDMEDGWEYKDPQDGIWKEDSTLHVLCVHPH